MNEQRQSAIVVNYVRGHGLAQLLFWSAFYYLLPALSAKIAIDTDWPVLHISTTFTFAFLLWAACAPFVGASIDAGHGNRVIRFGAMCGVVLLVILSQTDDKTVFSVVVILLGACMAATLYDPCFALMVRRFGGGGANAVARVTLIAGFSTFLTFPLIFGLSGFLDWNHVVLVFAVLGVVGVTFLPNEIESPKRAAVGMGGVPFGKGPALIALSFGLVMMGHAILLFLLPVALSDAQSDGNITLLALAVLGPAQIAGRTAWTYYGVGFSAQGCATVMFICLCVPPVILLSFRDTQFAVCLALFIQGACYGVHTILRPCLAQCYVPDAHFGRVLGMVAMVGLLMMALGPAIGGLVWTLSGLSGLLVVVLSLNLAAFLLGLALRRVEQIGAVN